MSVCDIKRRTKYNQYKVYMKWKMVLFIDFTILDVPICGGRDFFRLASFNLDLLNNFSSLNMDGNLKVIRERTSFA